MKRRGRKLSSGLMPRCTGAEEDGERPAAKPRGTVAMLRGNENKDKNKDKDKKTEGNEDTGFYEKGFRRLCREWQ